MRKIGLPKDMRQFLRYCVVGSISTVIDIGGLYILVEFAHFQVIPAAIISFSVSVVNGFIFNRKWTFRSLYNAEKSKQFIKFLVVAVCGLILNTLFMYFFVDVIKLWYINAKIITTGLIFFWSFFINKKWTFV